MERNPSVALQFRSDQLRHSKKTVYGPGFRQAGHGSSNTIIHPELKPWYKKRSHSMSMLPGKQGNPEGCWLLVDGSDFSITRNNGFEF